MPVSQEATTEGAGEELGFTFDVRVRHMGGGEGDDQNKKTLIRKQMAEFGHMQQILRMQKKTTVRRGAPPTNCQKVAQQAAQQAANQVYMQCRNDVAALLNLVKALGGFKNKTLVPKLNALIRKYQL